MFKHLVTIDINFTASVLRYGVMWSVCLISESLRIVGVSFYNVSQILFSNKWWCYRNYL